MLEAREKKGERLKPGKEIYSRCAKSLVRVGRPVGKDSQSGDRHLGFPLELFAKNDPTRLAIDGELTFDLTYLDQPLAHALVGCMEENHAADEQRLRTDEKGKITFRIRAAGVHLVRVVHMVSAAQDAGADWESFWASMTFEVSATEHAPSK